MKILVALMESTYKESGVLVDIATVLGAITDLLKSTHILWPLSIRMYVSLKNVGGLIFFMITTPVHHSSRGDGHDH